MSSPSVSPELVLHSNTQTFQIWLALVPKAARTVFRTGFVAVLLIPSSNVVPATLLLASALPIPVSAAPALTTPTLPL